MKYKGIEEAVEVWSVDPPRKMTISRLAVGAHGLPVLMNAFPATQVWDFPACWLLMPPQGGQVGVLLTAWRAIHAIQADIASAEREIEEDDDDTKERAQERMTENGIERELTEGDYAGL